MGAQESPVKLLNTAGQYGPYTVAIRGDVQDELWIFITWQRVGQVGPGPWVHWNCMYPKWEMPRSLDLPDPALLRDLMLMCRSYIDANYYLSMPLYRYIEKMMGEPDAQ